MIPHPFKPDPHGRDVCDAKLDDYGRIEFCGRRRSEHMDSERGLQIQLATALRERDTEREFRGAAEAAFGEQLARTEAAESERDSLRTALTEINDLLTSVPEGEDWRKVVRRKVVVALFGEAAWSET